MKGDQIMPVPDGCPQCTFRDLEFTEHPCDVCIVDENGVSTQFRAILCHNIEEELTDEQSFNVRS